MPEQDGRGPQAGFLKATGKSRLAVFIVTGSMALSVPAWPQTQQDVTRAQTFDTQRLGVATTQVIPPIQQWACAHLSFLHSFDTVCRVGGLVQAGSCHAKSALQLLSCLCQEPIIMTASIRSIRRMAGGLAIRFPLMAVAVVQQQLPRLRLRLPCGPILPTFGDSTC